MDTPPNVVDYPLLRPVLTEVRLVSPAAEGEIRVTLEHERTVLVGRNGAGKSAILETIAGVARTAAYGVEESWTPLMGAKFMFTLGGQQCQYRLIVHPSADESGKPGVGEACDLAGKRLWEAKAGVVVSDPPREIRFPPNVGLVASGIELPSSVAWLEQYMKGVRLIRAGVPRAGERAGAYMHRRKDGAWIPERWVPERVGRIAATVANWSRTKDEAFEALRAMVVRLGLGQDLALVTWDVPDSEEAGGIRLDARELGKLPDGTLRVLELAVALVDPGATLVLIEEPETSVHPGLLDKVLSELEAVSSTQQVVLSTHSPQVVSWARPADVRLVTWEGGKPTALPLDAKQMQAVRAYLTRDGNLGEFLFEGGIGDG